jgi:YhcH/YjgK/YiaL family protein
MEANAASSSEGDYPLDSPGFLVRVMAYPLKTREEARYESHRRTIDVQYTIEGGEGIEIASLSALQSLGDYCKDKDVEHFKLPDSSIARVENLTGRFTVLFPGEPHLPQLLTGEHKSVRKLVVKIPAHLVGPNS